MSSGSSASVAATAASVGVDEEADAEGAAGVTRGERGGLGGRHEAGRAGEEDKADPVRAGLHRGVEGGGAVDAADLDLDQVDASAMPAAVTWRADRRARGGRCGLGADREFRLQGG